MKNPVLHIWAACVMWRGYRAGRRGEKATACPPYRDWRTLLWITGWLRATCPSLFNPELYFDEREP